MRELSSSDLGRGATPSSRWRNASLLLLLLMASATRGNAQPNHLQNGNFDSDISGWMFYGDGTQAMQWDGTLGSPSPGSMRITAVNSPVSGAAAASECVAAPVGTSWTVRSQAREDPGSIQLRCGLLLLLYVTPDCSDPTGPFVEALEVAGTDWTPLSLEYTVTAGFAGIRVAPTLSANAAATGSCNFDSVRLLGPPSLDVPVLGHTGMIVLIAALALAGVLGLRRLR